MLDTHARKIFNPIFSKIARLMIDIGLSANQITFIAFVIGILSAVALYFNKYLLSFMLLWLSGLFDAVDGEVARMSNKKSLIGAQLDIVSDRVVELAFIWAVAFNNKNALYELLFLVSMILISMAVFLTTGMIAKNNTKKSFYYQSGLMERTEGFIMFSLMIIFREKIKLVILIYALLILITIIQRLIETMKINKEVGDEENN